MPFPCRCAGDGAASQAAWGKTSDIEGGDDSLHHLPEGVGIDGTGGTQPRYTRVLSNVVREIGMNERQSSAWSEAKACLSEVDGW